MDTSLFENRRILVIDDNEAIHADFRKILAGAADTADLDRIEADLFGSASSSTGVGNGFSIESAYQGQEGHAKVWAAKQAGTPFAVAFVDVRMPPGWDGIETALHLWSADPNVQIVLCTAYSDYSWDETVEKLGSGDRFLILKKPFDTAEVRQLALSLSVKWTLARQARLRLDELEQKVSERTRELSKVNAQLQEEISHRERMELELVRAQKLESLGQLVAGIAHEINNPLGFVISNLGFLEEELGRPAREVSDSLGELSAVLRETSGGARRIGRIVRDLKTFCRTDESAPSPVAVHEVLDSALNIARVDMSKTCTLTCDYGEVLPVLANGSRLGQVFLNLLINALQALPAGQKETNAIVVRTRLVGDRVHVEVSDNGSGIPREILGKIFDPFFTTKPVGQGTGLGLSICHGIIEAFGGSIEVESEVGKGSLFRVRLRVAPPLGYP
jgi:two-component system, NtrC family, sensor kinase